jgi:hypothetical protein
MKTEDSAESTLRVIAVGVWAVAIVVMTVSATTSADLFRQHAADWLQGLALGLAIDAALAVALVGDQVLAQMDKRSSWGTTLRWVATGMSLILNCSASALGHDLLGMTLHAIPPLLLIVLTEAAQSYRTALTERRTEAAAEQARIEAERIAARQEQQRLAEEKRQRELAAEARRRDREQPAEKPKQLVLVKPKTSDLDVPGDAMLKDKARAYFMQQAYRADRDPLDPNDIKAVECDRAVGASVGTSKRYIKGWRDEVAAAMEQSGTAAAGD